MNIFKYIIYNTIFIAVWLIPIYFAITYENSITEENNLQVPIMVYTAIVWYVMGIKIYPLFKIRK
jgi:hypothetical protein